MKKQHKTLKTNVAQPLAKPNVAAELLNALQSAEENIGCSKANLRQFTMRELMDASGRSRDWVRLRIARLKKLGKVKQVWMRDNSGLVSQIRIGWEFSEDVLNI
jgi:hypothetical protein